MKLFLGWSGDASHAIAQQLHGWLPQVLPRVRPWLSSEDIGKGSRWSAKLARELEQTNFGIICVTPHNAREPWLNYEAGSLAKLMSEAHVAPILVGLEAADLEGPLSQFQLTKFSKRDMKRLIETINRLRGPSKLPQDQLQRNFQRHWPRFVNAVERIPLEGGLGPEASGPAGSDTAQLVELPELSDLEEDILKFIGEMPDEEDREWIDIEDIRRQFDLPTTTAEYHLLRLTRLGLLCELDGVWELSYEGMEYVVTEGLLD